MRSMGESLTQYIKKKKGGKPNNSGDTPRRGTRSEVGSEGKAAPSPGHRRSNLQPDTQHGKQGGGGPLPLPGLVSGGVGYRAGLCFPRGWLRTRGAHHAPHRLSPKPLLRCVSFPHKQGLGHDRRRWCSPAPGEGLCPFSEGGRQALGPENTFMWQRQGAGAFSVTPRLSPEMAAVGGSPSAGLSPEPT